MPATLPPPQTDITAYSQEIWASWENVDSDFRTDAAATRTRFLAEIAEARQNGEPLPLAWALLRYGSLLLLATEINKAIEAFLEGIELARTSDAIALSLHYQVGRAFSLSGDASSALDMFWQGIALARTWNLRLMEARFLRAIGFIYAQRDEPEPFLEYTLQALLLARELNNKMMIANTLCNCGGALSRMKRHHEAMACYDEGLPIALEIDWPRGHALFLAGIGGVFCEQRQFEEGVKKYQESEVILSQLGDHFQITRHRLILGRYFVEGQRAQDALPFLLSARELAEQYHFEVELCETLEVLSRVYEDMNDPVQALRTLRQHFKLRQKLNDKRNEERLQNFRVISKIEAARLDAERAKERSTELFATNQALRDALQQQKLLQAELERLASTDVLTGLANRRQMSDVIHRELERALRNQRPLALVLLDIDRFKSINDRFGHAIGDDVLVEIGKRLAGAIRIGDHSARWGGEEFCLLLVESDAVGAQRVAERVRQDVRSTPILTRAGPVMVTISIGVAIAESGHLDADMLLIAADTALYEAKENGRDRVVMA